MSQSFTSKGGGAGTVDDSDMAEAGLKSQIVMVLEGDRSDTRYGQLYILVSGDTCRWIMYIMRHSSGHVQRTSHPIFDKVNDN